MNIPPPQHLLEPIRSPRHPDWKQRRRYSGPNYQQFQVYNLEVQVDDLPIVARGRCISVGYEGLTMQYPDLLAKKHMNLALVSEDQRKLLLRGCVDDCIYQPGLGGDYLVNIIFDEVIQSRGPREFIRAHTALRQ